MNSALLRLLIPAVLTPLLAMGAEKAKEFFQKQIEKDSLRGQAEVGITYCACKGFLDKIVADTEIPYDDQAVAELEKVCEDVAEGAGFTLQQFKTAA